MMWTESRRTGIEGERRGSCYHQYPSHNRCLPICPSGPLIPALVSLLTWTVLIPNLGCEIGGRGVQLPDPCSRAEGPSVISPAASSRFWFSPAFECWKSLAC
ncbi:hypothetical protein BDV11DRAFT_181382, partial [Aspergillus similis]